MDAIDQKQQDEIDSLRRVNDRQDNYISNIIFAFLIFAVIQFSTTIMLMLSSGKECPHSGCQHSQHVK